MLRDTPDENPVRWIKDLVEGYLETFLNPDQMDTLISLSVFRGTFNTEGASFILKVLLHGFIDSYCYVSARSPTQCPKSGVL